MEIGVQEFVRECSWDHRLGKDRRIGQKEKLAYEAASTWANPVGSSEVG